MAILFQVLRGGFYFASLLLGVMLVRGEVIFGAELSKLLLMIFLPMYLLLCGVMIGYLISLIWSGRDTEVLASHLKQDILKKSFIIGIVLGLVLALAYLFI